MRQALLAATREQFDVLVRDAALGEVAPDDAAADAVLEIAPHLFPNAASGDARLDVSARPRSGQVPRGRASSYEVHISKESLPSNLRTSNPEDLAGADLEQTLIAAVDAADGFPQFLHDWGLVSRSNDRNVDASAADDVQLRLREMSVVPQFEAVRSAHALPPGVEKERLLALGYANLCLLTQHLWSADSKVFAARALVYAERAARAEPGPDSDEVRAYAAALVGLHMSALKHAEAAGADRSPRLKAVVAYCRYRYRDLIELSESAVEVRELAAVLACLAADPAGVPATVKSLKLARKTSPDCFRVYEGAAISSSINLLHDLTVRGPQQLVTSVPARLKVLPGLPREVAAAIPGDEQPVLPAQLADRLDGATSIADNPTEPSWPVLGGMLRDEALVQAFRRLSFMGWMWGVPTTDEYDVYVSFVGEHPYKAMLQIFADPPDNQALRSAASDFLVSKHSDPSKSKLWTYSWDFGPRHWPIAEAAQRAGLPVDGKGQPLLTLWLRMFNNADLIADDLVQVARAERSLRFQIPATIDELDALAEVSPHHPRLVFRDMQRGTLTREQLADVEKNWEDQPELLSRLGAFYILEKRPDDAIRVLKRAVESSPSFEAFQSLSEAHQQLGQTEEFVANLEKAFEYPCFTLQEVDSRILLARHYIDHDELEKAEPHVLAAAESYAARGLYIAVEYFTLLEEWETAERWASRLSARYPETSGATWYFWCRATGRGNEAEAAEYADLIFAGLSSRSPEDLSEGEIGALALYHGVQGRDHEAGDLLKKSARDARHAAKAMIAASFLLRSGAREEAVQLLGEASTWTNSYPQAADAAGRAKIFHEALMSGQPLSQEVIAEFDQAIESWPEQEHLTWRTHFGEILMHTGNTDDGLRFLSTAAGAVSAAATEMRGVIAAMWLRDHKRPANGAGERGATGEDEPDV